MRYLALSAVAAIGFGIFYLVINYRDLQYGEMAMGNPAILQMAAKNGDPQTQLRAAGHLLANHNTEDIRAGIKLLEDLAERGEPQALQRLGMMHLQGLPPLAPDPRRGLTLLIKAAEGGNEPARGTLLVIYGSGRYGIPADRSKAAYWARGPNASANR